MDTIGKYEIIEKIGSGGFGEVFKGFDPFIKRHVAIKTCRSGDEEIRTRFFQEAEIAGNLHHRNITTVYDFGVHDELPYLIQEYLSGEDLNLKIKRRDSLPFAEKLYYLLQIARGLEHAHVKGVVHRDIKPSNIRILEDGTAKIMDFGIAKLAQRESSLTQTGMTLGTAAYLAPEQIRGEEVDQRTDIFSFGVLTYELLTYERPFRGEQISAVLYQILHGEAPALEDPSAEAPAAMARLIGRCLAKEPKARYQDSGGLLHALEGVQRGSQAGAGSGMSATIALRDLEAPAAASEPTPARPAPEPPEPAPPPPESHGRLDLVELQSFEPAAAPPPTAQESIALAPERRRLWPWLLLALLLALAGGGWWVGQDPSRLEPLLALARGGEEAEPEVDPEQDSAAEATAEAAEAGEGADSTALPADLPVGGESPGEGTAETAEEGPAGAPGDSPPEGEAGGEAASAETAAEAAESPPPPPPPPATLRVEAAPWAERMTLRLGSQGRLYTLDSPVELSLPPALYRLRFRLEHSGYQAEAALEVRLEPGGRKVLAPPIEPPAALSVRARPGRPQGQVLVNGEDRGSSPLSGLFLAPGLYLLEIRPIPAAEPAEGEEAEAELPPAAGLVQSLELEAGRETIVTFDLEEGGEPAVRAKDIPPP